MASTPKSPYNLKKKDKPDFYISLVVIILFLSFIIYYSFESYFNPDVKIVEYQKDFYSDTMEIENKVFVPIQNISAEETKEYKSNTIQIESQYAGLKQESSEELVLKKESIEEGFDVEDAKTTPRTIVEKRIDEETEDVTSIDKSMQKLGDSLDVSIENKTIVGIPESPSVDQTTSDPVVREEINSENETKECVIIIGAYKEQKNINKLIARLEKQSYDHFEVPFKNTTRVGVKVSCDKNTLSQKLLTVRQEYADDAFVLQSMN